MNKYKYLEILIKGRIIMSQAENANFVRAYISF